MIVSDNGRNSPATPFCAGPTRPRRLALHRAGQADAERLHRELQRPAARRVPERDVVPLVGSRPRHAAKWRADYNVKRPHSGLGWQTPAEFAHTFRGESRRCAIPRSAPAQAAPAQPAQRAIPTARANSKLDKTWGQGQWRQPSLRIPTVRFCSCPVDATPLWEADQSVG